MCHRAKVEGANPAQVVRTICCVLKYLSETYDKTTTFTPPSPLARYNCGSSDEETYGESVGSVPSPSKDGGLQQGCNEEAEPSFILESLIKFHEALRNVVRAVRFLLGD